MKIKKSYDANHHCNHSVLAKEMENMSGETQPLPFEEITQGPAENYITYRKLTPETFQLIKGKLGKPIEVTFTNESWIYQGPDEEDHDTSKMHINGILTNVDERTIEVEVNSGETTYDTGAVIKLKETHKELPFYQHLYSLRCYAEISQIRIFTVENQIFQLDGNASNTGRTETKNTSIKTNESVEKSIQEISGIISSYATFLIRPDIARMTAVLKPLNTEEFPLLYVKLAELANSPLAEVRFDSLAEIMSAAESDRQFGQISDGMAEWYENGARAAAKNQQSEERVLDSIVNLVKLVEKNRKEPVLKQALKPTKQYVVLYDNGDDMQACHGKKVDVPEGEDPWEFARAYLLSITSPGENGLLLEEVEELKPGEPFRDF